MFRAGQFILKTLDFKDKRYPLFQLYQKIRQLGIFRSWML